MLRIIPSKSGRIETVKIFVTPDMSIDDRGRLASLANVMYGEHVNDPEGYEFTRVRGEKAWLLFRHGFRGVATYRKKYTNERSITHPKYAKCFHLSAAVVIAKLMEPATQTVENWG